MTIKTMEPAEKQQSRVNQMDQAALAGNILDPLPKTMIIFDADAFIQLFPYCRAILEREKVVGKGDEDLFAESIGIYMLSAVIDDLRTLSEDKCVQRTAVEAMQMLNEELLNRNPYLEIQSCEVISDIHATLGTPLSNAINERIQNLVSRGASVITVTECGPLQSRLSDMSLEWLSVIDFLKRFHWLTPTVTAHLDATLSLIGLEAMFRFVELISISVIWKGVITLLAPMSMPSRLALFPLKALKGVLQDIIYYRQPLQAAYLSEVALDFSLIAKSIKSLETFHITPAGEERVINCVFFLDDITQVGQPIAKLFANMRSRLKLLIAVYAALQRFISLLTREPLEDPESFDVFTEQIPLTSTPRKHERMADQEHCSW